jgi:hypothetical protein
MTTEQTSAALRAQSDDLEDRREKIVQELHALSQRRKALGGKQARAEALLAGEPLDPAVDDVAGKIDALRKDIDTIDDAQVLLSARLAAAHEREFLARLQAAKPAHDAAVKGVIKAALALYHALKLEESVREAALGGCTGSMSHLLRGMQLAGVRPEHLNPQTPDSPLSSYIREAITHGKVLPSDPVLKNLRYSYPGA